MRIRKALVPAAGKGTRMFPLSSFLPKEMLPKPGDFRPLLEHVVQELVDAGIDEIGIVIREEKKIIRQFLEGRHPKRRIIFLYQQDASGLVDALLTAGSFLKKEHFLLVFPDQFLKGADSASRQLLWKVKQDGIYSAVVKVPQKEVSYFQGTFCVKKGKKWEWRGFGRTVLPHEILEELKPFKGEDNRGYRKAFQRLCRKFPHTLVTLKGAPEDLGTTAGYRHYVNCT